MGFVSYQEDNDSRREDNLRNMSNIRTVPLTGRNDPLSLKKKSRN